MKFLSFPALACLVFLISCNTAGTDAVQQSASQAPEDAAITKAVADAYQAICFKPGQKPDYEGIKKCFTPGATLISFRDDSMQVFSINQFVDYYKMFVDSNKISSFYEEEIKGTTDQFGRVAQRMSAYKTYINTMDSVTERGVNSFQTVKTPQGWKVSSIIWDVESASLKIPDQYLKTGSLK